jgi:hypothetical protein
MHKEGDHPYPGIWEGRTNGDVYVAKRFLYHTHRERRKNKDHASTGHPGKAEQTRT